MKLTLRLLVGTAAMLVAVPLVHAGKDRLNPYTPGVNGVTSPRAIEESKVAPVVPDSALEAAEHANVTLEAIVRKDGTVASVKVLGCDTPGVGVEEAVADAVRQWRFEPGTWRGQAVDTVRGMKLHFGDSASA